jgi:hypothetical protein
MINKTGPTRPSGQLLDIQRPQKDSGLTCLQQLTLQTFDQVLAMLR